MFVGLLMSSLGSGLTMPFLYVYLADVRHISTAVVGLIFSAMGVASVLVVPVIGTLIDRFGPRGVLIASMCFEAIGIAAVAQVHTAGEALLVGCLIAIFGSGGYPAAAALLTRLVPQEQRETAYGVQFMLLNAGLGLGGLVASLIVNLHDPTSFEHLYYLDALTYLAYIVTVASMPRGSGRHVPESGKPDGGAEPGWSVVLRDKVMLRFVMVSALVVTCGYAQMETGFAAYVVTVSGVDPKVLGLAYGANTLVIVLGQLVTLRLIQGRSRTRLLALASLGWSGSWLVIAFTGLLPGWWAGAVAVVGLGLFGVAETLWQPVSPAVTNAMAREDMRGRYNALAGMTWTVAGIIGPASAGLLIGNHLAFVWVLFTVGGTALGSAGFLALRHRLTPAQDGQPEAQLQVA